MIISSQIAENRRVPFFGVSSSFLSELFAFEFEFLSLLLFSASLAFFLHPFKVFDDFSHVSSVSFERFSFRLDRRANSVNVLFIGAAIVLESPIIFAKFRN